MGPISHGHPPKHLSINFAVETNTFLTSATIKQQDWIKYYIKYSISCVKTTTTTKCRRVNSIMCSVGVLLLCTHIQAKWVSEYNRDWERSSDTPSQLELMERDWREKVKATQIWKFKLSVLTMGEVVTMHSLSQYKATLLWESCWRTLVTISCKISSRKKKWGWRVLECYYKCSSH